MRDANWNDFEAGALGFVLAALLALATSVSLPTPPSAHAAFPGADGRIAFSRDGDIYTILPDGSGLQQLTDENGWELGASWSADGKRLVFTHHPPGGGGQIVTMAADGTDRHVVAGFGESGEPYAPSFSPSGRRIVYTTLQRIRTIGVDGGDRMRIVRAARPDAAFHGVPVSSPQYSPNGKRILFQGLPRDEKEYGLYTVRPSGSHVRWVTDGGGGDWSPNGRRIIFHTRDRLRLVRADGTHRRSLPVDLSYPAFSPSGSHIVGLWTRYASIPKYSCSELVSVASDGSDFRSLTGECDPAPGSPIYSNGRWQPLADTP